MNWFFCLSLNVALRTTLITNFLQWEFRLPLTSAPTCRGPGVGRLAEQLAQFLLHVLFAPTLVCLLLHRSHHLSALFLLLYSSPPPSLLLLGHPVEPGVRCRDSRWAGGFAGAASSCLVLPGQVLFWQPAQWWRQGVYFNISTTATIFTQTAKNTPAVCWFCFDCLTCCETSLGYNL